MRRRSAAITASIALFLVALLVRIWFAVQNPKAGTHLEARLPEPESESAGNVSSGSSSATVRAPSPVTLSPQLGAMPPEPPRSPEQLASLLREIRVLGPGPEKDTALALYLEIKEPSLAGAVIDELLIETDRVLRDHHVMLLQRLADHDTIKQLTRLIDQAKADPERQELLLGVFENMISSTATDGLGEIVRNPSFTFREPLLFYAMRSLARSDNPNALRPLFERMDNVETPTKNDLSIAITAAVEATHPAALPTLLEIASADEGLVSETSRLIALYTLRNYRDDPNVQTLLEKVRAGSDPKLAAAAAEALTTPP